MVMIQPEKPHPFSWGGFFLWGCPKCGRVKYVHSQENNPQNPIKNVNAETVEDFDYLKDINTYAVSN